MRAALAATLVWAAAWPLSGCSDGDLGGTEEVPASTVFSDGGEGVAGEPDEGGAPDAGSTDGGADGTDAGEPDAGGPDAGPDVGPDAGPDGEAADINGFDYPCEPGTKQACVTACGSAGSQLCLKAWGPCVPPLEFCGNCVDDDCDGLINEDCPPNPDCEDPQPECPVAVITVAEGGAAGVGTELHLSGASSFSNDGDIVSWAWSVDAPAGSANGFAPSAAVEAPTFTLDVAGIFSFYLDVVDSLGTESCVTAQYIVNAEPDPPLQPEIGCADGAREGFLDQDAYPQIAGCAGGWELPGITPESVAPTCGLGAGDDSGNPEGWGCSAPDLCASGWHICATWQEVAARSPTGCVGAVPEGAPSKSIFWAIRQPSETGSVCGGWGDGFNDVFGCGNLGAGLGPDKGCGPLDRVLASTQPQSCGFNEAEPPLGPWECDGDDQSHLSEGALVTKKGCGGTSCSYDGAPVGNPDKGGVLCCRDAP